MRVKTPIFDLKKVSFAYDGKEVVKDITLSIGKGEYIGVIGPNGGGKTTLLRLMLGLLKPTKGTVTVNVDRRRVGYVPQRTSSIDHSFPATVREVVESGQIDGRYPKLVDKAMRTTNVTKLASRRINSLSGGERQRVLVARALASDPAALMLDEPTTAIDAENQEEFYKFIRKLHKELGLTIVIVSHDVDVISHEVERTICLNRHLVCHEEKGDHLEHYGH